MSVLGEVQTCIRPSWCHCRSLFSCLSKIQIGFTFLVPAHPDSPRQRAVKCMYVCVCPESRCLWSYDLMALYKSVYYYYYCYYLLAVMQPAASNHWRWNAVTAGCCSTDSDTQHHYCHLPNKFASPRVFPVFSSARTRLVYVTWWTKKANLSRDIPCIAV